MNGLDAEIKKYVKRVRRRLSEKAVLQMLLFGMLAGFGAAVVISLISLCTDRSGGRSRGRYGSRYSETAGYEAGGFEVGCTGISGTFDHIL